MSAHKVNRTVVCWWAEDEDGNWDTGCDEKHIFTEGNPTENKHRYCPYCGRPLKARTYVQTR